MSLNFSLIDKYHYLIVEAFATVGSQYYIITELNSFFVVVFLGTWDFHGHDQSNGVGKRNLIKKNVFLYCFIEK